MLKASKGDTMATTNNSNNGLEEVWILSAARTPIGSFLGALKDIPAPKLGATAIAAAVERAQIQPDAVEEVLMGCVLPAGIGQAPARQATLYAKLPKSTRATTINRVCGSGLKAVMLATQGIQTGEFQIAVAGGMENMSLAPYLLPKAREGLRMGNAKLVDSMIFDGLWDPYGDQHMGNCAELCSRERKITRAEQDAYARLSYERAMASTKNGAFKAEMAPVDVVEKKETKRIDSDEEPFRGKLEKFPDLKPSFEPTGTVTAANASSLNDGASALVLASATRAKQLGLKPIARILGQASFAQSPEWFTTAPVGAVKKLMEKTGMTVDKVDLFEINEAFAVVAIACMRELGISEDKCNIRGGAVAMGHPIGSSGARILTTLVHALRAEKKKYGVAAICIGGGEASAVLVEAIS
jgi:acetyl-CoA C-acetyltransferase